MRENLLKHSSLKPLPGKIQVGLVDLVIIALAASVCVLQLDHFADDPGVGWHLKTGDWIWFNSAVPFLDPFLKGAPVRTWICDQWLSDLLGHLAFQVGGFPFLYAAAIVIHLTCFFALGIRQLRLARCSNLACLVMTVVGFKVSLTHFVLRPMLLSFAFFSALLLLLYSNLEGGTKSTSKALLLYVFLLFIIWSNMHPAFSVGLIILCIYSSVLLFRGSSHSRWIVVVLPIAGLLGSLLNPNGLALHQSVLELAGSEYFMHLHTEWAPLRFATIEGVFVLATLALMFGWIGFAKPTCRPAILFGIISALLLAVMTFRHVRMLPYYALGCAYPCAMALDYFASVLINFAPRATGLLKQVTARAELSAAKSKGTVGLILVSISLVISAVSAQTVPLFAGEFGPTHQRYPYAAVNFLSNLAVSQNSELVVVAPPEWGGFITWQGRDRLFPVIDDRNTLLGEKWYQQFYSSLSADSTTEAALNFLTQIGSNIILVRPWSQATALLKRSPQCRILFQDSVSLILAVGAAAETIHAGVPC